VRPPISPARFITCPESSLAPVGAQMMEFVLVFVLATLVTSDGGKGFFDFGSGDGDVNGSFHCVLPVFELCQ
jgi:hypothetical protein